jgi:hypothetical protein
MKRSAATKAIPTTMQITMIAIVVVGRPELSLFGVSVTVEGSTMLMIVDEKTESLRPTTLPGAGCWRHPACRATRSRKNS